MAAPQWLSLAASFVIHPGIGVARVGNSTAGHIIAPEVPGQRSSRNYKDSSGKIKPQAARFRVYAHDAKGNALGELSPSFAKVCWRVRLANRKAAHSSGASASGQVKLRNADIKGDRPRRTRLVIDAGEQCIDDVSQDVVELDTGTFQGNAEQPKQVSLGSLRTDDEGRLLVIGSRGRAESTVGDNPATLLDDNDDWFDDTADGPVHATVQVNIDGEDKVFEAGSAWVVVAPPDYAPDVLPIVDLHQVVAEASGAEASRSVDYYADIYPILRNVTELAWVSESARRGHGRGAPAAFDLSSSMLCRQHHDDSKDAKAAQRLRRKLFSLIRKPLALLDMSDVRDATLAAKQATATYMPPLPGDTGVTEEGIAESWLSYSPSQYRKLERWAQGDFVTGEAPSDAGSSRLEDAPIESQPALLQRAVLERCAGGGFGPGYEVGGAVTDPTLYRAPFRLHDHIEAGSLTEQLCLPWQLSLHNTIVNRWPSQVPLDVLPQATFEAITEGDSLASQHVSDALDQREKWDRGLGAGSIGWLLSGKTVRDDEWRFDGDSAGDLIRFWSELGVVRSMRLDNGEHVLVEAERHPYAGLNIRALYHGLLNGNKHPAFLSKARAYVDEVLKISRTVQTEAHTARFFDCVKPFDYSESLLDARLKDIYNDAMVMAVQGTPYRPEDDPIGTRELTIERVRQFAPFNLVDGSWLRNVKRLGPADEVNVLLGKILDDELGNGVASQNHASIYARTCHSVGYYPQDIRSEAFCFDPTLMTNAYENPAFQLAISEFTDEYYPEIIGMTLYLEWTVLSLKPVAEKLKYFGIDTEYFDMHLAIDNASAGHGRMVVDAIKLYMAEMKSMAGERGAQAVWQRIWDGMVAFSIMQDRLVASVKAGLQHRATLLEQMHSMLLAKREFGQFNHHQQTLGGWRINDLFDHPDVFLNKLADSKFIDKLNPQASTFFNLLAPDGCMYGVFTQAEIELWHQWVESLGEYDCAADSSMFIHIGQQSSVAALRATG